MYKVESQTRTLVWFLGGGQSLGARIALRRNDSFEDLKETK